MANVSRGNFMMKKFIALGMSLLMLLSVCLTGCAEKTDEEAVENISKKASKSAVTLSMYLMSDAKVDKCKDCVKYDAGKEGAKTCVDAKKQPCTFRLISDEVNKITESKYKVRLVLNYYTEKDYYKKLEAAFKAREEAKKKGQLIGGTINDNEQKEDETFVNELGQIEIKYPTIAGYQVDIFFMGGETKFNKYKEEGLLSSLDTELSDASKKLTQYIFPQFLSGIKTLGGGTTYAIPNNRTVGEYTYLLLNKQALNETYRRTEGGNTTFDTYTALTAKDCERFLDDVKNYQSEEFYPIYKDEEISTLDIAAANVQFFGANSKGKTLVDDFSLIGGYYAKDATFGTGFANYESILDNAEFRSTLETLKKYEQNGYYYNEETDAGKKPAVQYIKGGAEIVEQYGDEYEVLVVENPQLDKASILESTFAVNANTTSLSRSMQILTLLNTDEDFRNLILYGIEGEHYRVIDTGVEKNELGDTYKKVERLNNKYKMDENKTGNVFISYPLQEVGKAEILPSIRDWGIKQNQDMTVDLLLDFDINNGFAVNATQMKRIRTASRAIWKKYEECDNFEEFITYAQKKVAESKVKKAMNNQMLPHGDKWEECDQTCKSMACAYRAWLQSKITN